MINLDELWIGDKLRVKSSGLIGVFTGDRNGKAGLKIQDKISYYPIQALEIFDEDENESEAPEDLSEDPTPENYTFEPTIDLHIEKWKDYRLNSHQSALDFQLRQCRLFLDQAIDRKVFSVLIIHGKGVGILKQNIRHLLGEYTEVFQVFDKHQGGATEVWFNHSQG